MFSTRMAGKGRIRVGIEWGTRKVDGRAANGGGDNKRGADDEGRGESEDESGLEGLKGEIRHRRQRQARIFFLTQWIVYRCWKCVRSNRAQEISLRANLFPFFL
jgi:hypothetical protein